MERSERPPVLAVASLLATAVLLITGCGNSGDPSEPATRTTKAVDAPEGRIVFRRFLDDDETTAALFTSRPDGSAERQITHPDAGVIDDEPDWAPDGSRIVFSRAVVAGTSEAHGLFTVAPDGTGLTALSANVPGDGEKFLPGWDVTPAFSPDGQHVAFTYLHGTVATGGTHGIPEGSDQIQYSDIAVMDVDGSHRRLVTRWPTYEGDSGGVAWSPDGSQLVYGRFNSAVGKPAGCLSLYLVLSSASGQNGRRLTPCSLGAGGTPDWSSSGLIVFRAVRDEESGIGNFFTISSKGGEPHQVTRLQETVISHQVSFSPDGKRIVFAKAVDGRANDLFTIALDGSDERRVTSSDRSDSSPAWGPTERQRS
ncbi:MAG: TolB family protein [Marmoricola sp.]